MTDAPNLYGVAPGVDFPAALIAGLERHMASKPPEDWARVTLILNTRRMARRVRAIFDAGPPRLLPRVLLLTALDDLLTTAIPPTATPALRRRLELSTFVARLLKEREDFAAQTSVYDLADSLARLMDELQGEGVAPGTVTELDVSQHSAHFAQTQAFLQIIETYLARTAEAPDPEARQRLVIEALISQWQANPPAHPVILAGSTASRGTTRILAEAVARLDQGAVVLPGYDFEMPDHVWATPGTEQANGIAPMPAEDHPQYRFHQLQQNLGVPAQGVTPCIDQPPPSVARNRLISLALRPAPVTDAWRREGPHLGDLNTATEGLTFVKAETQRAEALAIALRLRQAAEEGTTAALITPDRMLTRQVAAALDQWHIVPDDSAGLPLHLSPVGRFLRHPADALAQKMTAESLLSLLKHPLTHAGDGRNWHNLNTQRLELLIRHQGMPFPDKATLTQIAPRLAAQHGEEVLPWLSWVADTLVDQQITGQRPLEDWVAQHSTLIEAAAGSSTGPSQTLWDSDDGQVAYKVMQSLQEHASESDALTGRDYATLLHALLSAEEVRSSHKPHPHIMIWGTLEARVQGAELVILGSLNDGTWPEQPAPDPWLNRALRQAAGLLLPDRRIGLSAHDFQQAIAAREVWITRSVRSSDAETVPSRWINRLTNLMSGLKDTGGPDALAAMTARGDVWLAKARAFEAPIVSNRAKRPAPRPSVAARPRAFSVSDIRNLIRDPYSIYAKHVLGLRALGPLVPQADALLRGTAMHQIFEDFVKAALQDPARLAPEALLQEANAQLESAVPWPAARQLWQARIDRIADWFVETELVRQTRATPTLFEGKGRMELASLGVTITARADRIDQTKDGALIIYDYKTGAPPTEKEQVNFERQLLIEAAMAEQGAFADLQPQSVQSAQYIGLGSNPKCVDAPLVDEPPQKVLAELHSLIASYLEPDQGFLSLRAIKTEDARGDYDQLARFGEWDVSDPAHNEVLE